MQGFQGREISCWERYTWQKNLCPGKVSGNSFLPAGYSGQRNLFVKVSWKSFSDCKSWSDSIHMGAEEEIIPVFLILELA